MPRYPAKEFCGAETQSEAKIQMHRGYVKVWRKLEGSGILKDERACQFFLWAMLKATHKPRKQIVGNQVVELEPGQFVSGRKSASEEMDISEMVFRGMMKKMENMDFVTIKPTNKFSIFTINNWTTYQCQEPTNNQQTNQQVTNNEPTNNQQVTTNKNIKNTKNEKNTYTQEFEKFWSAYPSRQGKKVGKKEAFAEWQRAMKDVDADYLVAQIESLAPQYGEYPVDACRWLKHRRWEDEITGAMSQRDNQFAGVI